MMNDAFPAAMEKQHAHALVKDVWELCKPMLSAFVGLSALCGYLVGRPVLGASAMLTALAVFVLSCGCSMLNNVQDMKRDALYDRTCKRVLPDGRLSAGFALVLSGLLIALALFLLGKVAAGPAPMWIGLLSVVLYNGLYTPMKPLGLVCLVPGVMCGMAPPWVGWAAVQGGSLDVRIVTLMMVFGFWQLPHLGFLTLSHPGEYRDRGKGGLWDHVTERTLKRMVVFWVINFSLMMICLIFQEVLISSASRFLVGFHAVCLSLMCMIKLRKSGLPLYRELFVLINVSLLWVMVLIVSERMLLFS